MPVLRFVKEMTEALIRISGLSESENPLLDLCDGYAIDPTMMNYADTEITEMIGDMDSSDGEEDAE